MHGVINVVVIIAVIEMFRFVAGSKKSTRGVGDSGCGSTAACDFLRVAKSLPISCREVMDNVMRSCFVAGSKKSTRMEC